MSDKKSEAEKAAKEYVADYVSESARDFASFGFMSGAKWALDSIASEIKAKGQETIYSREVLAIINELQGIDPDIKAIAQGIRGIK